MALFMDRHDLTGMTFEDVADADSMDVGAGTSAA
jgi:hypothetical protein